MTDEILAERRAQDGSAPSRPWSATSGTPHRPRLDRARRAHPGRLLRHPDAAQPAGHHQRARGAPDRDPAVGPQRPGRDREGDPEERHRPHAEHGRHGRPAEHPAAHRGASQGPRQDRPQAHGRGAGRDPQPSPRGRTTSQEGGARRRHRRRRGAPRARTAAEGDRPLDRRGRPPRQHKEQEILEVWWQAPDCPLARPTDAPPPPTTRRGAARRTRPRPLERAGARRDCRATSRSSWTATAAGRGSTACPRRGSRRRRRGDPRPRRARRRRGVEVLSIYAFSRENWARADDEVGPLRPPRAGDRAARPTTRAPGRAGAHPGPARGAARRTRAP